MILKTLVNIFNQSKEKQIGRILTDKNLSVSCAESCTGGLLSSLLTDISGSSAYINQNFVTYANEAKVNLLGVNPKTIEKYGVVSEEIALEMASGLIEIYNCDLLFLQQELQALPVQRKINPSDLFVSESQIKIKKLQSAIKHRRNCQDGL